MDDNLIGYLLDALDPETHRLTEEYLERTPEARQRLEKLRGSLAPLALDSEPPPPPADLVMRTLAHVAEFCCRDLPHAPPPPKPRPLAFPGMFRRLDVLLAACLMLMVGGTGVAVVGGVAVSWVMNARTTEGRLACEKDLSDIYLNGLQAHQTHKGHFPNVNKVAKPPRNVSGLVVPMLVAKGYLPEGFKFHCPGKGPVQLPIKFETALSLDPEEFDRQAPTFTPGYGYTLGYRDADGNIHGPSAHPQEAASSFLMLMADTPPAESALGNSPNHGGYGQNVLFLDGHTKFAKDRISGLDGDDMYLNKNGKQEAGLDWRDIVIGGSSSRP